MRRTPRVVIDRRGVLISLVAELRTRTLIVDVEPFLSTWDAAADTVIAATTAFATDRLGGNFLHWRPGGTVPLWPRVQTIAGKLIENVFFSPQDIPAGMDIDSRM
jgi:hypothetical protein